MRLVATPCLDGTPLVPNLHLVLPVAGHPPQWVEKSHLEFAVASFPASPPARAAADAALAALPTGRLLGLAAAAAAQEAVVAAGSVPLRFTTPAPAAAAASLPTQASVPPGTKGARAPPGTLIRFLVGVGAARLGVRVELMAEAALGGEVQTGPTPAATPPHPHARDSTRSPSPSWRRPPLPPHAARARWPPCASPSWTRTLSSRRLPAWRRAWARPSPGSRPTRP